LCSDIALCPLDLYTIYLLYNLYRDTREVKQDVVGQTGARVLRNDVSAEDARTQNNVLPIGGHDEHHASLVPSPEIPLPP
jgi:hypothetical protein